MLTTMDDVVTVKDLMRELGYDDEGRAVRAALRKAFPGHPKNSRWDPLSPVQISFVRKSVSPSAKDRPAGHSRVLERPRVDGRPPFGVIQPARAAGASAATSLRSGSFLS